MSDTRRRILIFLLVTFGIAWAYAFLAVYPMSRSALASYLPMVTKLVTGAIMLAPSIAVIVTRAVTGEGFQGTSHLTSAGFDKTWRYWLAGYLGPVVLAAVGACLYYLVVPGAFDPSMSYAREELPLLGNLDLVFEGIPFALGIIVVAPMANFVYSFGEEWGWRGYLFPKLLEEGSVTRAILASGLVWGAWNAPLVVLGSEYGAGYAGFPAAGVVACCAYCTAVGVFLSYLTLRSGSCIPATLAHGSLDGTAGLSYAFARTAGNPLVGPASTGILGDVGFVVAAVLLLARLRRLERAGEPLLVEE